MTSGSTALAETSATTVTLSGWASSPEETAALNRTIASFERLNRDIDVQYSPISGDYDSAMLARFAAKRPPDVFYVDSLDVPDYRPALQPLNGYMARTRGFSTRPFFPSLLSAFVARQFGIVEAIAWALACVGVQFVLVFAVGFLALGLGPG